MNIVTLTNLVNRGHFSKCKETENRLQHIEEIIAGLLYKQGAKKKQICKILEWTPNNKHFELINKSAQEINGVLET